MTGSELNTLELSTLAQKVLSNLHRVSSVSMSYAQEWPRLREELEPILVSLSDDLQRNIQRDISIIQDSLFEAHARLGKAAAALLVAADAAHDALALPPQIICRLERAAQSSAKTTSDQSNIVYLQAHRERLIRKNPAAVAGQCRVAETENNALGNLLDKLEAGFNQLASMLAPSIALNHQC